MLVTDQTGELAALELRHRQRARVEDRIRAAKATGLRNLPFDRFRRNQVWLELVLAAQDLTCWLQALLLDGELAICEPKRLRYRLLHVAARVVRHARRLTNHATPALLAVGNGAGRRVCSAACPAAALLTTTRPGLVLPGCEVRPARRAPRPTTDPWSSTIVTNSPRLVSAEPGSSGNQAV